MPEFKKTWRLQQCESGAAHSGRVHSSMNQKQPKRNGAIGTEKAVLRGDVAVEDKGTRRGSLLRMKTMLLLNIVGSCCCSRFGVKKGCRLSESGGVLSLLFSDAVTLGPRSAISAVDMHSSGYA